MTVKLSHERNVRSLAKKTLGSTRVGRAIRLPVRMVVSRWSKALSLLLGEAYPVRFGAEVGST